MKQGSSAEPDIEMLEDKGQIYLMFWVHLGIY